MLEAKWQEYKDDGLQIFVLMGEGGSVGMPANQEALQYWSELGATFSILNDPLYEHSEVYFGEIALGSAMLLRPGVEVAVRKLPDLEQIEPQ